MFLRIALILNLVYNLRCDDSNTSLEAEAGMPESTIPSVHIDQDTYVIFVIVFFIVVISLSIVALLYGFRRGQQSVRLKKSSLYNLAKSDLPDDSTDQIKEGTSVAPLHKTESLRSISSAEVESSNTIRSESAEAEVDKPQKSPTNSDVLAYSTQATDSIDSSSTSENTKLQSNSSQENKDQNNSSDKQ